METSGDQNGSGEARMIFRWFAWVLLCCLKFSLESRSHPTQGCKGGSEIILPREGKGEEIVAAVYSPVTPCLGGCAGAWSKGWKGKGSMVTGRSDSWAGQFCMKKTGHQDSQVSYWDNFPMS
jgi:hypothetical protein